MQNYMEIGENKMVATSLTWESFKMIIKENGSKKAFYRGVVNSKYKLKTTLARRYSYRNDYCSSKYHKTIIELSKQIPTIRKLLDFVPSEFILKGNFMFPPSNEYEIKAYATILLMIHLRHHGIPSPLLDWSRSPYISAFFALSSMSQRDDWAIFSLKKIGPILKDKSGDPAVPRPFLIDNYEDLNEKLNNILVDSSLLERHRRQESALINNLQKFLLELGKGFSFIARQKRLSLDGDHFAELNRSMIAKDVNGND